MSYSDFLNKIFDGLEQVVFWLKSTLFPSAFSDENPIYVNYYFFTFFGISLLLIVLEELFGLLTAFKFGGFFMRRFRVHFPRGYDLDYKVEDSPDYTKDSRIRPFGFFMRPFYRQKYTGKYFINYNGRYFPVRVPRYNPFAIRKFNAEYKAGHIVSYDKVFGNSYNSEFKPSKAAPILASNISGSMSSSFDGTPRMNLYKGLYKDLNLGSPDDNEDRDYMNTDEVAGNPDFEGEDYVGIDSDDSFLHYDRSEGVSLEDFLASKGYSLDDIHF